MMPNPGGWDPGPSQDSGSASSSEALRDRYIEKTLEKILRHQRHPRSRPADLVIIGLLVLCLGVVLFRPVRVPDNARQLKEMTEKLDRLAMQQADLEKHLAALHGTVKPHAPMAEEHRTEAPPVVEHAAAAPAPPVAGDRAPVVPPPAVADKPVVPPPAAATKDEVHVLKQGESLWSVCQKTYGDPKLLDALVHYNGISDPNAMKAGMAIRMPSADILKAWHPAKAEGKK